MLETVRAWLNGTRDYKTGAALFAVLSPDTKLASVFNQGQSLYNKWRLQEELLLICKQLKKQKNESATPDQPATRKLPPVPGSAREIRGASKKTGKAQATPAGAEKQIEAAVEPVHPGITENAAPIKVAPTPLNIPLYDACKKEADIAYKEAKNMQAVLFAMIPGNEYEDANRQDLVAARQDVALAVVVKYNEASRLYDQLDFVRIHGKLPHSEPKEPEIDFNTIPDHLVKKTLDNARKNYNKMVKREQTPERIQLQQKHEKNIKILEARWDLLKLQS